MERAREDVNTSCHSSRSATFFVRGTGGAEREGEEEEEEELWESRGGSGMERSGRWEEDEEARDTWEGVGRLEEDEEEEAEETMDEMTEGAGGDVMAANDVGWEDEVRCATHTRPKDGE